MKIENHLMSHPEKCHGGAALESAVSDLGLLGQLGGVLDGRYHPLNREEGGQVGGVRRDDDQSEEPPNAAHDSCACRLKSESAEAQSAKEQPLANSRGCAEKAPRAFEMRDHTHAARAKHHKYIRHERKVKTSEAT
jgi:hypothetical protein